LEEQMRAFYLKGICLCVSLLAAGWPSRARGAETLLYTTFRSDGGFDGAQGRIISAGSPVGGQFVTPANGPFFLSHIEVALRAANLSGGESPGSVNVSLRTNTAAEEPGAILEQFFRDDIKALAPTYADGTYSFASVLHPPLLPDTRYWLVVENAGDNSVKPFWSINVNDQIGNLVEFQNGAWSHAPDVEALAMRITGQDVPEPGGMLVVAMAGVGLCGRRRRGC
jgi:hypothetical protein